MPVNPSVFTKKGVKQEIKWSPSDSLADKTVNINKNEDIPATPSPKRPKKSDLTGQCSPTFYDFSKALKSTVNRFKEKTINEPRSTMFSSPSVLTIRQNEAAMFPARADPDEFELKLQTMYNESKKPVEVTEVSPKVMVHPEVLGKDVKSSTETFIPEAPQKITDLVSYQIGKVDQYEPNADLEDINFKLIEHLKNQNKNIMVILSDLKKSTEKIVKINESINF